ncbi:hypothetical protein TNCV_4878001 [Trichonephila clavipes]|nr:hypothetical protein TNCV_4878001 [Trichonephila clavipes]
MDVCKCLEPLRHGGTLNNRRAANPAGEAGGRGREVGGRSLTTSKVFSLKIRLDLSQIVLSTLWCLKLRVTTGVDCKPLATMKRWAAICHCQTDDIRNNDITYRHTAITPDMMMWNDAFLR